MTPIPIKMIIRLLSGVKATKLATVELNIYFKPLNDSKLSTFNCSLEYSKVFAFILYC